MELLEDITELLYISVYIFSMKNRHERQSIDNNGVTRVMGNDYIKT
jgi:hypothetical protein